MMPRNPAAGACPEGDLLWYRKYDFGGGFGDFRIASKPFEMDETGCYFLCNDWGNNNGAIFKISLQGDSLWTASIDPCSECRLIGVAKGHDESLMIAGYSGWGLFSGPL
ncbi:MAG: hypothetical protein IPP40_14985 [bacterium]|nr:hypothetical protein [bacterium]